MTVTVAVLAQVPSEAQCLPETLPTLAQLGQVVLVNADAGPEVSSQARLLGFPVTSTPWIPDRGALFTAVLGLFGDQDRILAHADEQLHTGGNAAWRTGGRPASASVMHRTGEQDGYVEEDEARCAPGGVGFRVGGRTSPSPLEDGAPVPVGSLPRSGIIFAHRPIRWPGLAQQRIGRTAQIHQAVLADDPADTTALYGLFRCHCSLRDWERARESAARWRAVAARDDANRPIVEYHEARAALAAGEVAQARQFAQAAVEVAPQFADAWYLLGELHAAAGEDPEADAAFSRAGQIGRTATPIATEDLSLATWRPLQARAALARRAGRQTQADDLLAQARAARRELRT